MKTNPSEQQSPKTGERFLWESEEEATEIEMESIGYSFLTLSAGALAVFTFIVLFIIF